MGTIQRTSTARSGSIHTGDMGDMNDYVAADIDVVHRSATTSSGKAGLAGAVFTSPTAPRESRVTSTMSRQREHLVALVDDTHPNARLEVSNAEIHQSGRPDPQRWAFSDDTEGSQY